MNVKRHSLPVSQAAIISNRLLMLALGGCLLALGGYLSLAYNEVFYGVILSLFASYLITLLINTKYAIYYVLAYHSMLLIIAFGQSNPGLGVAKVFTGLTFSLFTIYLLHMTVATIINSFNQTQHIARQERIRIMRDLHDSMGHQLQSAIFLLKHPPINQRQISQYLHAAQQHLELSIDAVDIKGPDLSHLLEKLVATTQTNITGIDISFNNEPTAPSLLDNLEYSQLRELQFMIFEVLSNALQHAKASQITLSLASRDGQILVTVSDNGVGFDPSATQQRGLMFLHKRAKRAAIQVHIKSQPGQTTTTFTL